MVQTLHDLLAPQRLTAVVDVGANPIDGVAPYEPLLAAGLCTVVGFEPQPEALESLRQQASARETYLPWALGDGAEHLLHICRAPGMTSLLKPDASALARFNEFSGLGEVLETQNVSTRRLDDVTEIEHLDFLKIDVQGSELAVFRHGRDKLAEAVVLQTELSFLPLYEGQPLFFEVDQELRQQGFVPHAFAAIKRWPLAPYVHNGDARQPLHQLLEADLIYVRDFSAAANLSPSQWRHLAIVAHYCFGSQDLVTRCLECLVALKELPSDACDVYFDWIGNGRPPAPKPTEPVISFDMDFNLR